MNAERTLTQNGENKRVEKSFDNHNMSENLKKKSPGKLKKTIEGAVKKTSFGEDVQKAKKSKKRPRRLLEVHPLLEYDIILASKSSHIAANLVPISWLIS
ncbi:hypothetical protein GCK72_026044 [Caenorhabditis remanei]|uniref:Uncharacterized protein n=1 Tax=Caenorhabditis remanei TaxID=31234 RepID=A0A6A5G3T3_CAERE|nr:hypothetical protein GCK72_026044 [Caenorhabditis remanei]KAF1749576.1 hypothetical protein GCK72_026044 [Caenorhabditis remanei]